MSDLEFILGVFIVALGLFAAGHMVGYHRGWQDGYWTEHPTDDRTELRETR